MNRRDFLKSSPAVAIPGAILEEKRTPHSRFDALRREGRRKVLMLPIEALETILVGMARGFDCMCLGDLRNLPANVIVEGVRLHEWDRLIGIMLWHESFDRVPDGEMTPRFENPMHYFYLRKVSDKYRRPESPTDYKIEND